MATADLAIELVHIKTDEPECDLIAKRWVQRMSKAQLGGRTRTTATFDSYLGLLCERDLARHFDSLNPELMTLAACLDQQRRSEMNIGPDFLSIDVKGTELGRFEADLQNAFDRDFRLFVKFWASHGRLGSQHYALVFRKGAQSWFVGWATQAEMLKGRYNAAQGSYELPVSRLHAPRKLLEIYGCKL